MLKATASIMTLMVLVLTPVAAQADPFVNPPELNHPDWVTAFPYQRNIMVGFDTDPHQWPDHVTSPVPDERKALTPAVVHHEGTDDPALYPSDWIAGNVQPPTAGFTDWLDTDTVTGSVRQGLLVLDGDAGTTFELLWHIDNWDRPWQEKHVFLEAEYYTTGNLGFDELISNTGQVEVLTPHYENLSEGWVRWTSWATLVPNPEWELLANTIIFEDPGVLLLDYMHIATECVPEPASLTLLTLAATALLKRR